MNNNFFFNRFLQLTGLSKKPDVVIKIFELGNYFDVTKNKINRWSKINEENSSYSIMPDQAFAAFIRGLLGYIRIKQSEDVTVFDIEKDFIDDVISMFFDYRDEMSGQGINIFNFESSIDKK